MCLNPLSAKFIKWSNTLKQFFGKLPTICLSVFDHFLGFALKGLIKADFNSSVSQDLIFATTLGGLSLFVVELNMMGSFNKVDSDFTSGVW